MSGWATAAHLHDDVEEEAGRVSVPFVLLAAVLLGLGLFLSFVWLITFVWGYFLGIPVAVVGFLLLFHPRAGLDRAD